MAVTQSSLRNRITRLVYSSRPALRPYTDKIRTNAHNIGDTTLDVSDGTSWAADDLVEFEDGEIASVTSVASNVLTVVRAQWGTTESNHAVGTGLTKNPRFSIQEIDDAIETVIYDLYPQLYVLSTISFGTVIAGKYWYPISTANVYDVVGVFHEDVGSLIPRPIMGWTYRQGLDATEFTNVAGLVFPGYSGATVGTAMYIIVKKKITAATDLLDRQEPLVAIGAAYHLLGGETVSRSHDPGQRTDRTVQPGQDSRDSIWFLREYRAALTKEEIRLRQDMEWIPSNRVQSRRRRFRG